MGRGFARLVTAVAVGLVAGTLHVTGAQAHDGGSGTRDDRLHARTDLVGVPVDEVERRTRANAGASGTTGRPVARSARRAASVSTDPGTSGRFGEVVATPLVPVHQAVLPSGKVLMWDSVGDGPSEGYAVHASTRAMVWNPVTNTSKRVDVSGYNIFCAGYAQLPDGRLLVVGGNKDADLAGIRQTHLFDWRTETWSRGPDMAAERWYPSVAALANGEAVIVGGGPVTAEVFQTDGLLRLLTGFAGFGRRLYPFLVPRGDGRVELVGPTEGTSTMTTTGVGSLDRSPARDRLERTAGSFATYAPDRTLVAGGGQPLRGGVAEAPTATAVVVDTSGRSTVTRRTGSMAFPRRQLDLTVLADGSVLATGGLSAGGDPNVNLDAPVLAAERWDPATGRWTTLASASRVRQYHSAATLLPDGRVLTGGGGICEACVRTGYLEKNVEYFSPPYLFRRDGSGALATRPTLTGVPASAAIGSTFAATSPQAGSIRRMALVRLGAPTHGVDQGQRYVPVAFSASGTTLHVTMPPRTTTAPPGYYMLFAIDAAGTPSVASMVRVLAPPPPVDLATARPATQSSTSGGAEASRAVDGGTDGTLARGSVAQTLVSREPWWQVDLGARVRPDRITVWSRTDCCGSRLGNLSVLVTDTPLTAGTRAAQAVRGAGWSQRVRRGSRSGTTVQVPPGVAGRYVAVVLHRSRAPLALAEVQVSGWR